MKYLKIYELSKNINKHKGLYIDTVRNNHTSIFNAFKKYLDKLDVKYNVDFARTGSKYLMFKYYDVDYKIRFANHTKSYINFGNGYDKIDFDIYVDDNLKIYDVDLDIATTNLVSDDLKKMIKKISDYNKSDTPTTIFDKYQNINIYQKLSENDVILLDELFYFYPNFHKIIESELNLKYSNNLRHKIYEIDKKIRDKKSELIYIQKQIDIAIFNIINTIKIGDIIWYVASNGIYVNTENGINIKNAGNLDGIERKKQILLARNEFKYKYDQTIYDISSELIDNKNKIIRELEDLENQKKNQK